MRSGSHGNVDAEGVEKLVARFEILEDEVASVSARRAQSEAQAKVLLATLQRANTKADRCVWCVWEEVGPFLEVQGGWCTRRFCVLAGGGRGHSVCNAGSSLGGSTIDGRVRNPARLFFGGKASKCCPASVTSGGHARSACSLPQPGPPPGILSASLLLRGNVYTNHNRNMACKLRAIHGFWVHRRFCLLH